MSRRYYSKAHYNRLSNGGPDTLERIRERELTRDANKCGHEDMLVRFGALTAENAAAAIRYQEERIRFHRRRLGVRGRHE